MEITQSKKTRFGEIKNKTPQLGWLKRYASLIAGIALIWIFAVYVTPWLGNFSFIKPLISFIKENDIKATAIYYTDIDEFAEADHMLRQFMTYPVDNTRTASSGLQTEH